MVKKAIYSYKNIKKYWKQPTDVFYNLAKFSVELTKRHYTTVLYCDKPTHKLFTSKGIEFDEVIYLDTLKQVNENNYGMSKILAMMEQTEPYIILDLDTLLFEPIETPHSITYGYKEGEPEKISGKEYINEYYLRPYTNLKNRIDIDLDWTTFPNNSLVVVKNPFIVREIYEKILKIVDGDYLMTTVQLYEQQLLYNYLKLYNVDIGFLYETQPVGEQTDLYDVNMALSKKFAHLDYYFRQPSCEILIRDLQKKLLK